MGKERNRKETDVDARRQAGRQRRKDGQRHGRGPARGMAAAGAVVMAHEQTA